MLNRIIDVALSARWIVLMLVIALVAAGGYALYTMPVEAFPDLTNNQVTVVTEAPSMPPTEVEQLVTYPVEQAMMGMPKQQEVRSLSKLGLSIITVVFDDSVSMYFARQMVNERLQQVTAQLPRGIQPLPVHSQRSYDPNGTQGSAGVADQAAASYRAGRKRNQ